AQRRVAWQLRQCAGASSETKQCHWSALLGHEHVRAVALQWAQRSEFRTVQGMDALNATLGTVHMQAPMLEIDLCPTQRAEFLRSQPMPIRQQNRCAVPGSIAPALPGSIEQTLHLALCLNGSAPWPHTLIPPQPLVPGSREPPFEGWR